MHNCRGGLRISGRRVKTVFDFPKSQKIGCIVPVIINFLSINALRKVRHFLPRKLTISNVLGYLGLSDTLELTCGVYHGVVGFRGDGGQGGRGGWVMGSKDDGGPGVGGLGVVGSGSGGGQRGGVS